MYFKYVVNLLSVISLLSVASALRVTQYNVEWLFLDQYKDCPGSGCTWKNQSEAHIHMNTIANTVNILKPDILNLCEVEGLTELNTLRNLTSDEYGVYFIQGTDSALGQNVGLLSKVKPNENVQRSNEKYAYPIKGSNCGCASIGSSGVSKNQYTTYTIGDMNILFVGAHLLAYPTDTNRCCSREAQMQVLQNLIYDHVKNNFEVILMGDFNDFDNKILDLNSNIPISMVLDIAKGNLGEKGGLYELRSAEELVSKDDRYSDWWDKNDNCVSTSNEFSVLDYILVTNKIYSLITNAFYYHGYTEKCGKYDSDHYPLVIDIDLPLK
jgi:exonuclease III